MNMPIETGRFVLREDQHLPQLAVEAVREREIDNAVLPPKRNGRLGPDQSSAVSSREPRPPARMSVNTFRTLDSCSRNSAWHCTLRVIDSASVAIKRHRHGRIRWMVAWTLDPQNDHGVTEGAESDLCDRLSVSVWCNSFGQPLAEVLALRGDLSQSR